MDRFLLVLLALAVLPASPSPLPTAPQDDATFDADWFEGLQWREVGPYRGGRSAAVAGIPDDRKTYYFGATGGGVWKTLDAGRS